MPLRTSMIDTTISDKTENSSKPKTPQNDCLRPLS